MISQQVEEDVQELVQTALLVAKSVLMANKALHTSMSGRLEAAERLDGPVLHDLLAQVTVPDDLRNFVLTWHKTPAERKRKSRKRSRPPSKSNRS